jgi:histidine triad (HIT) family protein
MESTSAVSNDCIFCQIVTGDSPASVIYEDDKVMSFLTVGPVNTGHSLVIPKAHLVYLADMDEETGRHLFTITSRIAQATRDSGIRCEGINLFLADGETAFQEVPHVHMHIFPRFRGDPFKLIADWSIKPPRLELDATAAHIREAYDKRWPASAEFERH